jgi:hypothetical protein
MDQRTTFGSNGALRRPIHGACLVAGCWCRSTQATSSQALNTRARTTATQLLRFGASGVDLTTIALRTVGLPVV